MSLLVRYYINQSINCWAPSTCFSHRVSETVFSQSNHVAPFTPYVGQHLSLSVRCLLCLPLSYTVAESVIEMARQSAVSQLVDTSVSQTLTVSVSHHTGWLVGQMVGESGSKPASQPQGSSTPALSLLR